MRIPLRHAYDRAMDVPLLSAVEQLSLLKAGKISPAELAEEHLRRIERLNPLINAFVDFDADRVRLQAESSHKGRLAGLPITVKSSIEVEGYHCEIGSTLRRGMKASSNAGAVTRLLDEGAIVIGTTNCPEFLMAYETDNLLDEERITRGSYRSSGGSSGGESAAIAAGLSAGGIGSDSGGSVPRTRTLHWNLLPEANARSSFIDRTPASVHRSIQLSWLYRPYGTHDPRRLSSLPSPVRNLQPLGRL